MSILSQACLCHVTMQPCGSRSQGAPHRRGIHCSTPLRAVVCADPARFPLEPARADGTLLQALTAQRAVQERYLPCSVQWFFERSELVSWEQLHTGLNVRRLLSASEVSAERVASAPPPLLAPSTLNTRCGSFVLAPPSGARIFP